MTTKIFSNRYFQTGAAAFSIAIAFFAYQNFTSSETETEASAAISETSTSTTATVTNTTNVAPVTNDVIAEDAENNTTEVINNTAETDKINTADQETTNK
jgi:hypothetical protein